MVNKGLGKQMVACSPSFRHLHKLTKIMLLYMHKTFNVNIFKHCFTFIYLGIKREKKQMTPPVYGDR